MATTKEEPWIQVRVRREVHADLEWIQRSIARMQSPYVQDGFIQRITCLSDVIAKLINDIDIEVPSKMKARRRERDRERAKARRANRAKIADAYAGQQELPLG